MSKSTFFQKKFNFIKLLITVFYILILFALLLTVITPLPKKFELELEEYINMVVWDSDCNNKIEDPKMNPTGKIYRTYETYNRIGATYSGITFEFDTSVADKEKDTTYDMHLVWKSIPLTVYKKDPIDHSFQPYKTYTPEEGIRGIKFAIKKMGTDNPQNHFSYSFCGGYIYIQPAMTVIQQETTFRGWGIGESVLLEMDLESSKTNNFYVFGKMENDLDSSLNEYVIVFDYMIEEPEETPENRKSIAFLINGKDIYGSFYAETNGTFGWHLYGNKLLINEPRGKIVIDDVSHELEHVHFIGNRKLVIKYPKWLKKGVINIGKDLNFSEIKGFANEFIYNDNMLYKSTLLNEHPLISTIFTGMVLAIFTFILSTKIVNRKSFFSFMRWVPTKDVDLIEFTNGNLVVGIIYDYSSKDIINVSKSYAKPANQKNGKWIYSGDVIIHRKNVNLIKKRDGES